MKAAKATKDHDIFDARSSAQTKVNTGNNLLSSNPSRPLKDLKRMLSWEGCYSF